MNPLEIINMIRNGGNPQQIMLNLLTQRAQGNPVAMNLLQLARNGDGASIERIARNIAKERGIDFDQAFNSFKSNLGL